MKRICTLLLSIHFFSCTTSIKNEPIDTGLLRFQNYNQEVTILPDDIVNMINEGTCFDPCFLHLTEIFSSKEQEVTIFLKHFLENKKFACLGSKKMADSQINFFVKQKVINFYMDDYSYLRNDIPPSSTIAFATFDKFYDFWYLGNISLNQNYESCLILMRDIENTTLTIKSSLFLMNVKYKQLLSITRIADYSISEGSGWFEYLKMEEDKIYSYRIIPYTHTDFNREVKYGDKESAGSLFTFDEQGYVKKLQNDTPIKKHQQKSNEKNNEKNERTHSINIFIEDTLVLFPDKQPEYPGGIEEVRKFIKNNIRYPKEVKDKKIEGVVVVCFIIEKDGTVSNIELINNSLGEECGAEAIRVISLMPKWKPGQVNGKNVRTKYTIPVIFSID